MAVKKTTEKKSLPKSEEKSTEVSISVVSEFDQLVSQLKGKTIAELRNLHADALVAESDAKRTLYQLQQRARNAATTAGVEIEFEIIKMKQECSKAVDWIHAIEQKLEGEFKDLTLIKFGDKV